MEKDRILDKPSDSKTSSRNDSPVMLSEKILRFKKSERLIHWALAVPFLVCFATALVLVIHYNPDPLRPQREVFSWMHRMSCISRTILPLLVIIRKRADHRIYFYNIKQAWVWTLEDFKWLCLMGVSPVGSGIPLPDEGKFNAAQKMNFMALMAPYPLYIVTGTIIWLTDAAFLSWVLHFLMAVIATPLITGHLYMAIINPGSRKGLHGMISGFVDRHWAKHHYGKWYREHHDNNESSIKISEHAGQVPINKQEPPLVPADSKNGSTINE